MFGQMTTPDPLPVPPWRTPARGAPPRKPLTQATVVEAGLRVLDAEGLEAISMRRVAQELGTGPASLYQHVSGTDELLELMLDRVAGEVQLPGPPDPDRWAEQLREFATAIWRALTAHDGIAYAAIARIPTGPNALALTEAMLGIMRAGGLPPQVCSWAMDNIYKYVTADAFEGSVHAARGDTAGAEERLDEISAYFASLPAERFPNLTSMVEALMTGASEERFAFGLEMLVRGLQTYAPPDPPR
jgi:AcrR family transcriptional regulator